MNQPPEPGPRPPPQDNSPWLAAVAVVPILATVYQTLVLDAHHGRLDLPDHLVSSPPHPTLSPIGWGRG